MGRNLFSMRLSLVLTGVLALVAVAIGQRSEPELKLVNVVFRHGDRAPSQSEVYPNDRYRNNTFYPMGRGGLTNAGKRRAYGLGQTLRSRYGGFVGPVYEPWAISSRSTDYDRTKMSLQLVHGGLYPPAPIQRWNEDLPWQPIPATYKPLSEDILFEPELCPKYLAELQRVRASFEAQTRTARFNALMEELETNAGRSYDTTYDMYDLYHTVTAQLANDLSQPDWINDIYPYGELWDATVLEYEIASYNDNLKRLNGGMFVRKISEDLIAYRNGTLPQGRRVFLYSGHETNIAALQLALGVYKPHVPEYTSAVIIELWQSADGYFVKVLHYLGIPSTVVAQKIPGCDELCPLDKFLELTRSVTPSDEDLICVKPNKTS